jgi:hypothetical protein
MKTHYQHSKALINQIQTHRETQEEDKNYLIHRKMIWKSCLMTDLTQEKTKIEIFT